MGGRFLMKDYVSKSGECLYACVFSRGRLKSPC